MYDDAWWKEYEAWNRETGKAHMELAQAASEWLYGMPGLVIDLGCGRLHTAYTLFGPLAYVGVDKHIENAPSVPGFRWIEADWRDVDIASLIAEAQLAIPVSLDPVWVTSLYAIELYDDRPDEMYDRAFRAGADAVVAAGVRYFGTDVHLPVGETGSSVRQTSGEPWPGTPWDETRITKVVPSKMFGTPLEVWRVMRQKG